MTMTMAPATINPLPERLPPMQLTSPPQTLRILPRGIRCGKEAVSRLSWPGHSTSGGNPTEIVRIPEAKEFSAEERSPMPRRAHTVGIIGLGFGRAHIPAFQANGCQVVAVCQRNAAQAKAVADKYGVSRVFERWEEMLEQVRPEIVVIATPPHLHHAIALRALAQGAHVLCEKPLAMTREEARAMVEAAARAGRVAMTCFNWRFPAAMQRLHAMVEEGFLGTLFHAGLR